MLISRLVLIAAAATLVTAPALADDVRAAEAKMIKANAGSTLLVCEDTALARMAWEREHGKMTFVTAEQAASGRLAETARPLCISEHQLARLKRMTQQARLEGERLASR